MWRSLRQPPVAIALAFAALLQSDQPARTAAEIDLALVLAIDCSYSVDEREYALQMQGFAEAFRSSDVIGAIRSGPTGRIAVAMIQWSGAGSQRVAVPWIEVGDAASALELAQIFENTPRMTLGPTSISGAMQAGLALHEASPYLGARRVIDISGDGINNNGTAPDLVRRRAAVAGVTVNGLAIQTDVPYLEIYFRNHVVVGDGSFVLVAEDYDAYHDAIRQKLLKEIILPIS